MREQYYGIFGESKCTVNDDGSVNVLVIVEESGCFAGAPPAEMRIVHTVPFNDEKFGKQYVAQQNRRGGLPYYLTWAKIKIDQEMVKYTDDDLIAEGIEPLKESD